MKSVKWNNDHAQDYNTRNNVLGDEAININPVACSVSYLDSKHKNE